MLFSFLSAEGVSGTKRSGIKACDFPASVDKAIDLEIGNSGDSILNYFAGFASGE